MILDWIFLNGIQCKNGSFPSRTSKINSEIGRPTVNIAVEIVPKIIISVAVIYLVSSFCSSYDYEARFAFKSSSISDIGTGTRMQLEMIEKHV